MPNYVEGDEVLRWLSDNVDYATDASGESLEDLAQQCAEAGSRQVEDDCERLFYRVTDEEREYRVDIDGCVYLVDLISAAPTVQVDADGDGVAETAVASGYQLLPRSDRLGRPSPRYQKLRPLPTGGGEFIPGRIVAVTGDWGFVEGGNAPAGIKTAATLRAAQLWMRRAAPLGVSITFVGSTAVQRMVKIDHHYAELIEAYRRTGYEVS